MGMQGRGKARGRRYVALLMSLLLMMAAWQTIAVAAEGDANEFVVADEEVALETDVTDVADETEAIDKEHVQEQDLQPEEFQELVKSDQVADKVTTDEVVPEAEEQAGELAEQEDADVQLDGGLQVQSYGDFSFANGAIYVWNLSKGEVTYDEMTNTLTLNATTMSGLEIYTSITIELVGDNTIEHSFESSSEGTTLTFDGEGRLSYYGFDYDYEYGYGNGYGYRSTGNVVVKGGTLECSISCNDLSISGGTVKDGVYAKSVTVKGGSVSGGIGEEDFEVSSLTMSDGTVKGGVYTKTFTMLGGTVKGGVYAKTATVKGGSVSGGIGEVDFEVSSFTMSGGTVKGGVYAKTATVKGGSVSGGIGWEDSEVSSFTMSGGTVGGDIYAKTVIMTKGSISGKVDCSGTMKLSGGTITYVGKGSSDGCSSGVSAATLSMTGGAIKVSKYDGGISVSNSFAMSNGTVTISSCNNGIVAEQDEGTKTANITIKGGKVTITNPSANGIVAVQGSITMTGGTVSVTGSYGDAMYAYGSTYRGKRYGGKIKITGGKLTAKVRKSSRDKALFANYGITNTATCLAGIAGRVSKGTSFKVGGNTYKVSEGLKVRLTKYESSKTKASLTTVKFGGNTYNLFGVAANAFTTAQGKKVTSLTFGKTLDYLGDYAFKGTSSLTSLKLNLSTNAKQTGSTWKVTKKSGSYAKTAFKGAGKNGGKGLTVKCGRREASSAYRTYLRSLGLPSGAKVVGY